MIKDLKIGKNLTNSELHEIFQVSNMGGMRKSNKKHLLVLISKTYDDFYSDAWVGNTNTMYYNGMGKNGDQKLSGNQNKTLNESPKTKIPVYLFLSPKSNQYCYIGQVKLVKPSYTVKKFDSNDQIRNVYIFPIQPIPANIEQASKVINNLLLKRNKKYTKKASKTSYNHTLNIVRKHEKIVRINKNYKVSKYRVMTTAYNRSPYIIKLARRYANGKCQLCGNQAPFKDKHGNWFLEVHHIKWLSHNGPDSMENVAAICPNCHRKMHIVDNKHDVEYLKERAEQIYDEHISKIK